MRLWIPASRPSSMPCSTRRPAARAAGSATSIRKARSARNRRHQVRAERQQTNDSQATGTTMTTKKAKKSKAKAKPKPAARKVVKLKSKKPAARKPVSNGLPRPSSNPWGQGGKALDGVRILDFTHVQSGPTCTQLLAYMGADVIKVERPGVGDITRGQLRDVPNADSLYFTMLNHNKRSITLDTKNPKGMEVLLSLIKVCDVLVENFAPGALDRMGLTWGRIQELNPRMIVASVKGFGPGQYADCKVYE